MAFVALMGTCIATHPSRQALARGLSVYGNDLATGVPFGLGILLSGALTFLALARLRPHAACEAWFCRGTAAIVGLTLLIPLTPYRLNLIVDYVHVGITSVVFTAALGFGGWIARRLLRHRAGMVAAALQLAAALLALATQIKLVHLMIPAEVGFELAFAVLVALAAARIAGDRRLAAK